MKANKNNLKKITFPLFKHDNNFELYSDGKNIYYFAKEGSKCKSGYFSDVRYLIKQYTDDYFNHAKKKGFYKNISIVQLFSIQKICANFILKQI